MRKFIFLLLIAFYSKANAQIPVEIFSGHKRSTVDIMFFKFFKNRQSANTRWLFFNRNRASVDYRMTKTMFLPQFGFTEALSYNHEKLKGFAPVAVGQILSGGVFPKAGIQYAKIIKDILVFSWLVSEIQTSPSIDYFLLCRFTPKITEKIHLFIQAESVNSFPAVSTDQYSFTQRWRLGVQCLSYQMGLGADFNHTGHKTFKRTDNLGAFIRHNF